LRPSTTLSAPAGAAALDTTRKLNFVSRDPAAVDNRDLPVSAGHKLFEADLVSFDPSILDGQISEELVAHRAGKFLSVSLELECNLLFPTSGLNGGFPFAIYLGRYQRDGEHTSAYCC